MLGSSSGLGQRPFKARTRIRIPSRAPNLGYGCDSVRIGRLFPRWHRSAEIFAVLAQLVRAPATKPVVTLNKARKEERDFLRCIGSAKNSNKCFVNSVARVLPCLGRSQGFKSPTRRHFSIGESPRGLRLHALTVSFVGSNPTSSAIFQQCVFRLAVGRRPEWRQHRFDSCIAHLSIFAQNIVQSSGAMAALWSPKPMVGGSSPSCSALCF